jgi:hypothetical protein
MLLMPVHAASSKKKVPMKIQLPPKVATRSATC